MNRCTAVFFSLGALLLFTVSAAAQERAGKWEVEFHGGGMLASNPTGGTASLPDPGTAFTTLSGRPSRRESSWYFGDGALLLNQVNTALHVAQITPLDPVLTSSAARQGGGTFGLRVSREINPRFTAELSVDFGRGRLEISDGALSAIEASRASFIPAFTGLFATGPSQTPTVTSISTIRNGTGYQVFTVGAVDINVTKPGKIAPFATVGGGLISNIGDTPSVTLAGKYQLLLGGIAPLSETDTVNVRYSAPGHRFVGVIGGGVKYAVSRRSGVRLDVRVNLSPNTIDTIVDANPVVLTQTPGVVLIAPTTPSIQFSTIPSVAQSSLTGPPIAGFRTFAASGVQRQVSVTGGWFWRFGGSPAAGRSASPDTRPRGSSFDDARRAGRWEVEFHGGGMLANKPSGGTANLPGPGAPFTTALGSASRRESSWYFGDGAVLLNQVSAAFRLTQKITPLDPVLNASVARQGGSSFGVRVSREINPRFTAELTVDYSRGRLEMSDDVLSAIEASRASFISTFTVLFATGPSLTPTVTSTSDIHNREGRQIFTVGAVDINLTKPGKLTPFATLGGGLMSNLGDTPSVTLAGKYQFVLGNLIPISETDSVTVRYSIPGQAFVGVIGGGLKYAVSPRSGVRVDVRAHLSKNAIDTLVDANPAAMTSTPAFPLVSPTTPSIQVSNNPSVGQSTLSVPIAGFQTFAGSGVQRQVSVTAGWFWRF